MNWYKILIILIFIIFTIFTSCVSASPLTIHFLDVGQGDSTLVRHDGHAMLIDAGDLDAGPAVLSYLRSLGVERLDLLVSSHPHSDHIGGMTDVLNTIFVDRFVDNGATHTSPAYRDLVNVLVKKQIPYTTVRKGDLIPFTDDLTIRVTNPDGYSGDLNEDSLGLLLTYGKVSVFFPGDCESCDAPCDIVKLAHHGSGGSATRGILKGGDPAYAIISLAAENDYHYPAPSTLNALENAGVRVYRTDRDGSVRLTTDGKTYWLGTDGISYN